MNRMPKGTLFKRGNIWWLKYKFLGRQDAQTLQTDNLISAENFKTKIMAEVHKDIYRGEHKWQGLDSPRKAEKTVRAIMLEDVWQIFETSADRPECSANTLLQYRYQFERWVKWIGEKYSDVHNIASVTKPVCREFVGHLRYVVNIKASTYNKYLNLLSLVFRVIGQQDDAVIDHWSKFPKRPLETDSRCSFSEVIIPIILSKAVGEMLTLCLLGLYTGLRLGDCCTMKWEQVNMEIPRITARPSKTKRKNGKWVLIPIHYDLLEHLKTLPRDSEFLCPSMAEKYLLGKTKRITTSIQKFFQTCGIQLYADGTGPGTGKRAVVRFGFHSFRHHFVTAMSECGVPRSVVMEIVNHGSPAMQAVYTHCGEEALQAGIEKLPSYKASPSPTAVVPA